MYDQPTPEPIATVWVCEDCMLFRETNETSPTIYPAWHMMPFADVSQDFDSDGDGVIDNAATQCRACMTWEVGSRFRYAVWNWDTDEPAVQS